MATTEPRPLSPPPPPMLETVVSSKSKSTTASSRPSSVDSTFSLDSLSLSSDSSSSASSVLPSPPACGPLPSPILASPSDDGEDDDDFVMADVQLPFPIDLNENKTPTAPRQSEPLFPGTLRSLSFRRSEKHLKARRDADSTPRPRDRDQPPARPRLRTKTSAASFLPFLKSVRAAQPPAPAAAAPAPPAEPPAQPEVPAQPRATPPGAVDRRGSHLHPYGATVPYAMSYNPVDQERDAHALDLLNTLSAGAPSFHPYGKEPPARVLDLGCGTGAWIVGAAQQWKSTEFWGLDLLPLQVPHAALREQLQLPESLLQRIHWTHGDFLQGLDFLTDTFDLVRMAYLGLALPKGAWKRVLLEVQRILKPGGRVEFIDEPLMLSSSVGGEHDICGDLEEHLRDMLAARGFATDSFAAPTCRAPTTLRRFVGEASALARFEIEVVDDGPGDDSTRYDPSLASCVTLVSPTSSRPPSPVRRASAELRSTVFVDGVPTRLAAADHAARSMHVLLAHKEALWQHLCDAYGTVRRDHFEEAMWEYELEIHRRFPDREQWDAAPFGESDSSSKGTWRRRTLIRRGSAECETRLIRVVHVWEAYKAAS